VQIKPITLNVNGAARTLALAPNVTLLQALRELGFVDVKNGCEQGDCGACTVLLDGRTVNSCIVLAWHAEGHRIITASGLGNAEKPHPVQRAFVEQGAVQCGYCTPGLIISATSLLNENPHPDLEEIRRGLGGNLCRCTGYTRVFKAVQAAAAYMAAEPSRD
jgi:aerobic-type carbon monoxide dehydrogenase small subunit (CoxS/CutS family)